MLVSHKFLAMKTKITQLQKLQVSSNETHLNSLSSKMALCMFTPTAENINELQAHIQYGNLKETMN